MGTVTLWRLRSTDGYLVRVATIERTSHGDELLVVENGAVRYGEFDPSGPEQLKRTAEALRAVYLSEGWIAMDCR